MIIKSHNYLPPTWLFELYTYLAPKTTIYPISIFHKSKPKKVAATVYKVIKSVQVMVHLNIIPTFSFLVKISKWTMLERIYNSHYGNGVPAMFNS